MEEETTIPVRVIWPEDGFELALKREERGENNRMMRILKARGPVEWAKLIRELEIPVDDPTITMDHVRIHAACVCWWDFFGGRPATRRWNHLDKYLRRVYVRVPTRFSKAALIALGYPEKYAHSRTRNPPDPAPMPEIQISNPHNADSDKPKQEE